MRFIFNSPYKSIRPFTPVDVNDFTVLVGRNGAGKTHFLKALDNGHVVADGVNPTNITYFNFESFLVNNQKTVSIRNIEDDKEAAWVIVKTMKEANIGDDVASIKANIEARTRRNPKQKGLIETGLFLSEVPLSQIDRNTFFAYSEFVPDDYQLLDSLSEIFFDYKKKYIQASLPLEHGGGGLSDVDLEKMNAVSPWVFLNRMFESFGLPHRILPPEFTAADIIRTGNIEYEARPSFGNERIGFSDLSSGERVLSALAITVFQDQDKTSFPDILLLDEIDASLHPSMVKNLIRVVNDVFLKNNCRVVLATHSPTTVSLVPEESIYRVNPGLSNPKLAKISQTEAVDILSEGLINLQKGLVLFDQISAKSLSIITEGHNVAHLKEAVKHLAPDILGSIDFVEELTSVSGQTQLKTLFDFFSVANHKNKVLFIFDCDVSVGNRVESGETYLHVLPLNENNTLVSRGIENIYPENIFDGCIKTETNPDGTVNCSFDPRYKSEFMETVLNLTDADSFLNYYTTIAKIKNLLNS